MTQEELDYDVGEYIKPDYVTVDFIKEEGKEFVVIEALGVREIESKEGEKFKKPFVKVQMVKTKSLIEYGFPKTAAKRWSEELETTDSREWIGTHGKFEPKEKGIPWVDAFIIKKPPKK